MIYGGNICKDMINIVHKQQNKIIYKDVQSIL
jgi:hypothetical protein